METIRTASWSWKWTIRSWVLATRWTGPGRKNTFTRLESLGVDWPRQEEHVHEAGEPWRSAAEVDDSELEKVIER